MSKEAQVMETKSMILKALIRLLNTTDYNKINVSKLCEEALVSRMSFYRHFQRVDDVIKYIYILMNEEILDRLKDCDKQNLGKLLTIRLHILKNNPYMRNLISDKYTLDLLFKYSKYDYIIQQNPDVGKITQTDKEFIIGGLEYIIKKWVESGMKEEIPELTKKILISLNKIMVHYGIELDRSNLNISDYLSS